MRKGTELFLPAAFALLLWSAAALAGMSLDRPSADAGLRSMSADGRDAAPPGEASIAVDESAAEAVMALPFVKTADVLVRDGQAYVSFVPDGIRPQLTAEKRERIRQSVWRVHPGLEQVWLSDDRGKRNTVRNYINDTNSGMLPSRFIREFPEFARTFGRRS